ncbi:MAG: ATP-grasp domain-containing protein [Armatimonadetes bacterium]|nr:ATP-grasp domain-containing protein [Armatimonadota bacterium]
MKKLLIANRGEIAVRIISTAKEMGIATVAVYSEADQHSMHVACADEAVYIGGSAPAESYLRMEAIIDAAKTTGADAIHPGYGFLSERAEFSALCASNGIEFIGPPEAAMRALGGKIEAKQIAVQNNVPITLGFFEPGATPEQLFAEAKKIGFPVMLKASAGGGGRGMRAVFDESEFMSACTMASDEATNAFGDGTMMVEKLVKTPRHVEVQIVADKHGNVAPLFERECSIQRRHQKLIEESPAPYFDRKNIWDAMRDAAVNLAKGSGYYGAGTVEFIVDPESGEFYFMEVNARLQVEHPVTEGVTDLDLVRLQIEIARGKSLVDLAPQFIAGDRANLRGHCLEVRIVAEDPAKNFLPCIGKIIGWAEPKSPGVRVDTGYSAGSEVSRFYDSMVAKLIVTAEDRSAAITRTIRALKDFHVLGVKTNIPYLISVLEHPGFKSGDIDTGFLGREFEDWAPNAELPQELGSLMMLAKGTKAKQSASVADPSPAWSTQDSWRVVR